MHFMETLFRVTREKSLKAFKRLLPKTTYKKLQTLPSLTLLPCPSPLHFLYCLALLLFLLIRVLVLLLFFFLLFLFLFHKKHPKLLLSQKRLRHGVHV